MFRIKRGPIGGLRPVTQYGPPAPAPMASAANAALAQQIAALETAVLGGPQDADVQMLWNTPRSSDGPSRRAGVMPGDARPEVPTTAPRQVPTQPHLSAPPRAAPVFTPPADRTPADWVAKGWTLAPTTPTPKTGAMARVPTQQTAPPSLPADMAPDDWRKRGWTLAP